MRKMDACPGCKRHVLASDGACPFCGATLTRRDFAVLASSILIGGTTLACDQDPPAVEYGAPRAPEPAVTWDQVFVDWRATFGLSESLKSWASKKPGTSVLYAVALGTTRITLSEAAADSITITDEQGKARKITTKPSVDLAASLKKEEKQEVEVDARKFNCDVRTYEVMKRTLKVWSSNDAPERLVKVEYGGETTELVALAEKLTVAGKEHSCYVWRSVSGNVETRFWRADGVPGLTLKWQQKTPRGTATLEVREIKEK